MNVASDAYRLGVVGPSDLVSLVKHVVDKEFPQLQVTPRVYTHEDETLEVIRTSGQVDAWLFTGVIPFVLAEHAGVLTKPAGYIPYTGATLYGALVEVMAAGHNPETLSIDTLDRGLVKEGFAHVGLSTKHVAMLEATEGVDSARMIDFHLEHARENPGAVAITCLRSVYDEIRGEVDAIRLAPAVASVRGSLEALSLELAGRISADAQVALGIVELPEPDADLAAEVAAIAGSVFAIDESTYLLVATRGVLLDYTNAWTAMPMLASLAARHAWVRIGLGIGRSAADAEQRARRAVTRCRTAGPYAAVFSDRTEDYVVTETAANDAAGAPLDPHIAAHRAGLSYSTIERLENVIAKIDGGTVTAAQLAAALDIEPRSARRTLKRLERAGVALPVGAASAGTAGRPSVQYSLRLDRQV